MNKLDTLLIAFIILWVADTVTTLYASTLKGFYEWNAFVNLMGLFPMWIIYKILSMVGVVFVINWIGDPKAWKVAGFITILTIPPVVVNILTLI